MAIRPGLLARAFFVAAAVTVPWTVYLAVTLPKHYTAHHYWLGWSGFDVALLAALVVTGRLLLRGDVRVQRPATVAATMLVVDAWFDVINASTPNDRLVAVAMAVLVELPLAYVCWRIARGPGVMAPRDGSDPSPVPELGLRGAARETPAA